MCGRPPKKCTGLPDLERIADEATEEAAMLEAVYQAVGHLLTVSKRRAEKLRVEVHIARCKAILED